MDPDNVTVECWFKTTVSHAGNQYYDLLGFEATGEYAFMQMTDDHVWAHSGGGDGRGEPIRIASNTWYRVSLKWARGEALYLTVYTPDGKLVGMSSNPLDDVPAQRVYFGNINPHGAYSSAVSHYDGVVIDWTAAELPILKSDLSGAPAPPNNVRVLP